MVDFLTGCDEPKFLDLEPETDENRWNIEDKSRYNGSNYLADWFTSIILEKWTRKIKDNFVCFRAPIIIITNKSNLDKSLRNIMTTESPCEA